MKAQDLNQVQPQLNKTAKNNMSGWRIIIGKYSQPNLVKSWWQICNSLIPYLGLWVLMVYSLKISYWLTLVLAVISVGFLVRLFIIFHDCGHGSFFKSNTLNTVVGILLGALMFTPYHKWHYEHQVHHQTVGNLDKRGIGDIMTLTVEEYNNRSFLGKLAYRLYRNPVILFIIAPIFLFTVLFRITYKHHSPKIKLYTHLTTLGLIGAIWLISLWIGLKTFLVIQIPVLFLSAVFGVWLFYVQHQFKDVVWKRNNDWDYMEIAMNGSSFLKLPRLLQWFSGNIGFHHIHHLGPRIPNYNLEKCLRENPAFQKKPLTFIEGIRSIKYRLWDEKNQKLVGFNEIAA